MIKSVHLEKGDTIATISPSWGCAGSSRVAWKYKLGAERLQEIGLNVIAAPNSMRGTTYLRNNPEARAEDILWAFENKDIKAIIANIGGNDSDKILPFLDKKIIAANPKILCGYSDVMNLHIYCHAAGLQTFYGANLLTTVAEQGMWHPYSKDMFVNTFFKAEPVGKIEACKEWSFGKDNHINSSYRKEYVVNDGYRVIQGKGIVRGKLFGGHTGLMEDFLSDYLSVDCFKNKIFFFEEIPEFMTPEFIDMFFGWMGEKGYLQVLAGIVIGKMRTAKSYEPMAGQLKATLAKYEMQNLSVLYGLNFGHSSPSCILPYECEAEINADADSFAILESGVN